MHVGAGKRQEKQSKVAANMQSQRKSSGEATFDLVDNRLEAVQLRKLQTIADSGPQATRIGRILQAAPVPAPAQRRSQAPFGVPPRAARPEPVQREITPAGTVQGSIQHIDSAIEAGQLHWAAQAAAWHKTAVPADFHPTPVQCTPTTAPASAGQLSELEHPAQKAIQRKARQIMVTGVSHLVKMSNGTIYGGDEDVEVMHGQELTVDDSYRIRSRRGPNQEEFSKVDKSGPKHYKWYHVDSIEAKDVSSSKLYIREDVFKPLKQDDDGSNWLDTVNDVVEAVTAVPATLIGNEGISGLADALNDKTVLTDTGGGSGASDQDKAVARDLGIAGDSITGITGLLGMAKGFKDLGDPEAKSAVLMEAALDIEIGAMKTGEAVSKLTHTAKGSQNPTTASRFGSTFEGYGAAFSALKDGFVAMRKLVTLINKHQDYSTKEKAQKCGEIGIHALESAKSVVLSVKSFIELVSGAASGGLMAAVPGLDIAVAGGKIIMDAYYLIISNNSRKVMNERIETIQGIDKQALVSVSGKMRSIDAEITNKKEVLKDDEKRIAEPKIKQKEKKRVTERILRLKKDIVGLEAQKDSEGLDAERVAEFTMATELRDANTKRVVRQGFHIATEMTKIAGSIAILTGAGSLGGAVTKGAAAAVDLALPAVRNAKQMGRDRAARKIAKGKSKSSKFDHTKSTAAKRDFRLKQVKYMIRMIVGLCYKDKTADAEEFTTVENYLTASGVSTQKLYRKNGDPQGQIQLLLEAIQERELI